MPGAKCIIPWCDRVCTTVICALCRERITRMKSELGGIKFGERPEAYRLLWNPSQNEFTLREAAFISGLPSSTIRYRIRKESPKQPKKVVKGGPSYVLSRRQVLVVARRAEQFRRHKRLYLSLSAAAILMAVHRETVKKIARKHNIQISRVGRYVFLDPKLVERLKLEKSSKGRSRQEKKKGRRKGG